MAAITADGRQELVALYLTMFGRAPTTVQLAQMVVARENGSTLAQVATTLAVESDFALIAAKDADSFATYLADALMATDIPASARAWAINWVVTQVQGTKTKAQVIAEAVQAIRATGNTNYSSSQAELAADVTSALTAIDNPSDSRLVALAQSYGVALDAFKSFISANVDHLAVCYAYVDQFGINFTNLLDLLQYKDESGLRKSLLEHGLDVTQLGIKKPAALGYSSNSTKLTTGAETYSGTDGKDSLDALAGDDVVNGLAGNDLIYGGEGNDTIDGGRGRDYLDGGAGNDTLRAGTNVTITEGSDWDSFSMTGSDWTTYTFDDVNAEFMYGRAGNDKLYGGYGSDYLDGGDGDDVLESDYNTLHTSEASASVLAIMLNDTLCGGAGADTLKGGDGNDTYLYKGLPGTNEVPAGETITDTGGTDTLWAMTSTDFSLLNGGTATLTSMGLDRVLINSGETATFTASKLNGTDISINASGTKPANLIVQGAADTCDFSKLKFSAFGSNSAFDSGTDQVTLDFSAQTGSTVIGTSVNDTIKVGAQCTVTGGAGADKFVFNSADVDTALGAVTHTITDFNVSQGDTLDVGISATGSNCILINLSPLHASVAELLKQADLQLGGTCKIVLGKVGNDFYVVSDLNGVGYTQVIRLVGMDSIESHPSEFILS
jgi:Ca2+-binding RTX toxin-like protein